MLSSGVVALLGLGLVMGVWREIRFREERNAEYLEQGRELVQVLVERLFNMPSTVDKVGRLVKLPKPTLQLPREKQVCRNSRMPSYCSWRLFLVTCEFFWRFRIDVSGVSFLQLPKARPMTKWESFAQTKGEYLVLSFMHLRMPLFHRSGSSEFTFSFIVSSSIPVYPCLAVYTAFLYRTHGCFSVPAFGGVINLLRL